MVRWHFWQMSLRKQTLEADWSQIGNNYLVEFYSDSSELFGTVAAFLSDSFKDGKAGIVIATKEHLRGIEEALSTRGLDPLTLQKRGLYIPLDAKDTLERFLVNDQPDRGRFLEAVGALVSRASMSCGGVRAFSEMAAALWRRGNNAGAIALESFWDDMVKAYPLNVILRLSEGRLHCR